MFKDFINLFKPVKKTYLLAFLISVAFIIGEIYLLQSTNYLPPQVPLWYSKTWGENQLSTPNWLWIIPTTSGAFLLTNSLLCRLIQKKEPTIAGIAIWSTTIISFASAVTLYRILMVVSL